MSNECKKWEKSKIPYFLSEIMIKERGARYGCEIGVRVTFNALVLTKSCQMSARNEGNLKFVIFIWNQDLRKGCEIGVRGTFNALVLIKLCQMSARNNGNLIFVIFI